MQIFLWEEGHSYYEKLALARRMAHTISTSPRKHDVMNPPLSYLQQQLDTVGCTCTPHEARISCPKLFFYLLSWAILVSKSWISKRLPLFSVQTTKKKKSAQLPFIRKASGRLTWGPSSPFMFFLADFIRYFLTFNCCLPDWRNIHH